MEEEQKKEAKTIPLPRLCRKAKKKTKVKAVSASVPEQPISFF